ncbi:MAG: S41 family peptidase, partial [Bacteroidia bacterium]
KGGDPLYAAYLFAYLAEKPFGLLKYPEFKTREALSFLGDEADSSNYNLYYRKKLIQNDNGTFTWDDRNNNWYGTFEPRAENYSGKVYVLMDGASFSTTGFFGSLIKYYKRGLIIGEESGGANVCNDCHGDLLLPNTHIRVEVPRCTVTVNLDGLKYNGHGIIPDHRISETAADIFSEKDSVLEYTLSLIREKK